LVIYNKYAEGMGFCLAFQAIFIIFKYKIKVMKKLILINLVTLLFTSCKYQKDIVGDGCCKGEKDIKQLEYFQTNTKIYVIGIDSSEFEDVPLNYWFEVYNIKFKTINHYNVFITQCKKKWKTKQIEITPVDFDIQKYHDRLDDGFIIVDTIKYCNIKL